MPLDLAQSVSIKRKLVGIILLTSLAVLTITCGALLAFEILSSRKTTATSLSTIADIVAENSSAALIFDDEKLAQEIISGLRVEPEIAAAALYNQQGRLVAEYPQVPGRVPPAPPGRDGIVMHLTGLTLAKPVMQGDQRVGTLAIEGTLGGAYRRLAIYGLVLVVVMVSSIFIALLLSNFFQRLISAPLLNLARTAGIVSTRHDYSVRAAKMSNDELGALTDAFNAMLDQIEAGHSALRESEERFRTLADNMAQLAWMADELGWATWYNKRWYDYTGTTPEKMAGRGWEKVHHPDHLERVRTYLEKCFAAGIVWEDTFPLRGRDGEYRWFLSRAVPIQSADGRVVRWFGTNTDVTEQRLVEEQLIAARDEAVRAVRTKDDFLAALSHELRTPLSPVLLLASDAARDERLPAEARAHFETIRKNVELEARLIDDLLDLTSITRGKLTLAQRIIPLRTVLDDALATVAPDIAAKRIEICLELDPAEAPVLGDAVRLQQVFWNVLKNAAKFTPPGGRITIRLRVDRAAPEVAVEIRDTGIGMTPDELERVFDAFAQGDHAAPGSAHRFGGLGLGLAISRSVIALHGGRIWAASAGRNAGSGFSIVLPLTAAAAPAPDAPPADGGAGADAPDRAPQQKPRILLVEDHAPTRHAITLLLQRRGYELTATGSLEEARAAASRGDYKILISDIGLPDGSGHELMQELRARHGLVGIALTGYGMEENVSQTLQAGFVVHLTKPIQVHALEEALLKVTRELLEPDAGRV